MKKRFLPLIGLFFLPFLLTAQTVLLSENFNDCSLPNGWTTNQIGGGLVAWNVGLPDNTNSDGSSIDGSCMLIIDDDATGDNTSPYILQFVSPFFDGTAFPELELSLDVHFRSYDGSNLKILVFDGTEFHTVKTYNDDNGTGEQFSEFENLKADLSFFASENMAIVIQYDDNEIWAWWAGVDNLEVIGKGTGENVLLESFNDCTLPTDWLTDVVLGSDDWQFGYVNNPNAVTSMNGSCFAYFDDDILGADAAYSTVRLISPEFDGSQYARYFLEMDLIFRKYADAENFAIFTFDGTTGNLVQVYQDDWGGPQFNEYQKIELDLSPYRTPNMRLIFQYQDGNDWGWWVGLDNVKIRGEGQINDLCSSALEINPDMPCLAGNNQTAIFVENQPGCSEDNVAGLWYRFPASTSGIAKLSTSANFNDVITVFNGSCTNPIEYACVNRDEFGFTGETAYFDVAAGNEYFIRVSGQDKTFGLPRGALCIDLEMVNAYPATPANDDCSAAIPLNMGSTCLTGNNLNAEFNGPAPSLNQKSRADIWYTFEANTIEEIEILSEADFADVITLYSGTCGSLVEVASNDHGQALRATGLTINETYYVQIAAYFATLEGNVCVSVRAVNPDVVTNDLCAEATTLTIGASCVAGVNIAATFSESNPSCEIFPTADVWYQFTAPASGGVKINTGADFVHTLSVYQGDCDNLEELLCESPTRCEGYFSLGGLIEGETYFIQIASAANPFGYLEGELCMHLLDYNAMDDFQELSLSVAVNCISVGVANLDIMASGGVESYTFVGTAATATLTTGDEYLVVLKDDNDCEVAVSGTVSCGVICLLAASSQIENITCFGQNDGQAEIVSIGGNGAYHYLWSNGAMGASQSNLAAGDYAITVSDDEGCAVVVSVTIQEPTLLTSNTTATGETMAGASDGTATADPMGGTAPYTFVWNNGGLTPTIENLAPEIYTVTISDSQGCSITETVVVSSADCVLTVQTDVESVSCFGAQDGSAMVQIMGGTAPFSFAWSNGSVAANINDLAPGNYAVTVYDANDCPATDNITIGEPGLVVGGLTSSSHVSCTGAFDGSATLFAAGGTPPYTYAWSSGASGASQENLDGGNYEITVTDSNGCNDTYTFEIIEPEPFLQHSQNIEPAACFTENGGTASIFISGGTPPYTFLWDDPAAQTTAQATSLFAGTYTVIASDDNGCSLTWTATVPSPDEIVFTIDQVIHETENNSDGQILITTSGGVPGYLYSWLLNGLEVSTEEDPTGLIAGDYTLIITDQNGCTTNSLPITIDNTVGITDPNLEGNIRVLPNPTSGVFSLAFSLPESSAVQILITDVTGKLIMKSAGQSVKDQTFPFDLGDYPGGIYPIEIFVGKDLVVKRVMVVK